MPCLRPLAPISVLQGRISNSGFRKSGGSEYRNKRKYWKGWERSESSCTQKSLLTIFFSDLWIAWSHPIISSPFIHAFLWYAIIMPGVPFRPLIHLSVFPSKIIMVSSWDAVQDKTVVQLVVSLKMLKERTKAAYQSSTTTNKSYLQRNWWMGAKVHAAPYPCPVGTKFNGPHTASRSLIEDSHLLKESLIHLDQNWWLQHCGKYGWDAHLSWHVLRKTLGAEGGKMVKVRTDGSEKLQQQSPYMWWIH